MNDMLSKVAGGLYASQDEEWRVNHPWDMPGIEKTYTVLAKAAIEALRSPTDEMLRAWVAASMKPGADPDEMVPVPGTGQGDMQFYERWRDTVEVLDLRKRHNAMIDEALEGKP